MTALEDVRTEIVSRRDEMAERAETAREALAAACYGVDLAEAELVAHDRAAALFTTPPEPPRRRNIADLVLERLSDEPATVEQLAEAIGAHLGHVSMALVRLGPATAVYDHPAGWRRP